MSQQYIRLEALHDVLRSISVLYQIKDDFRYGKPLALSSTNKLYYWVRLPTSSGVREYRYQPSSSH